MCLIFVAYDCRPEQRLLVAANRDEFHARPTEQAHFWDTDAILAGRDIEGGGTWMGVGRKGRFSALTNFRDASNPPPNPPSRGILVADFLSTEQSGRDYLEQLQVKARQYNGFSLLVADENEMLFFSNKDCAIRKIPPGVHGLSNHLLNEPWPKVTAGVHEIERMVTSERVDPEALFVKKSISFSSATNRLNPLYWRAFTCSCSK